MFKKRLKIDKSLGKIRRPWTSEEERKAAGRSLMEDLELLKEEGIEEVTKITEEGIDLEEAVEKCIANKATEA